MARRRRHTALGGFKVSPINPLRESMFGGALIGCNKDGRVIDWAGQAEQMFGYSAAEAIGGELVSLIVPESLRAKHLAGIEHYHKTGEGPIFGQALELPAVTKEGIEIKVTLTVWPVPAGEETRFYTTVRYASS